MSSTNRTVPTRVTALLAGLAAGVATLAASPSVGAEPAPLAPVAAQTDIDGADGSELVPGSAFAQDIPAPNVDAVCGDLTIFPQNSCTVWTSNIIAPQGRSILRQASVHTGPRTGPMRFEIIQVIRSTATDANGQPAPAACCFPRPAGPVFTPAPNSITTVEMNVPVSSTIENINGERVEVFDYLALSVLSPTASLPVFQIENQFMSSFHPHLEEGVIRSPNGQAVSAVPTISAIACPVEGGSDQEICQGSGGPGTGGSGTSFTGINPSRLLDTRSSGRIAAGSVTRVSVADAPGVPSGASGAVLNVTAVNASGGGFLTVFPCGETRPEASNVNFRQGTNVANAVAATFGSDGDVCVYSSVETHLLVDLNGALRGGFAGLTPDRLLDTRASSRVGAGSTTEVQISGAAGVPGGAVAAVLNVTAVNASGGGFLTVFPCGETRPEASNVNFGAGQNVANAVFATLGANGRVCVFSSVETHLLVDLNGALSAGFAGLTPNRLLDTRTTSRVAAGSTTRVSVAGAAGVPGDAVAAVLNVTAVNALGGGFLTVFPCGESQPTASNVNFGPGQNVANAVAATLGENGEVCVFSSAEAHLLVDLNGAFD